MLDIKIKTIEHADHVYPTIGNWTWKGQRLVIHVSDMSDWRHELLVAVHELVECYLCRMEGIPEFKVTAFDRAFEKKRSKKGSIELCGEPGEMKGCLYHKQHMLAEHIEHALCEVLEVKWKEYLAALNKMP